jgi:hypothetical protein
VLVADAQAPSQTALTLTAGRHERTASGSQSDLAPVAPLNIPVAKPSDAQVASVSPPETGKDLQVSTPDTVTPLVSHPAPVVASAAPRPLVVAATSTPRFITVDRLGIADELRNMRTASLPTGTVDTGQSPDSGTVRIVGQSY